jgi:hypothetical protein
LATDLVPEETYQVYGQTYLATYQALRIPILSQNKTNYRTKPITICTNSQPIQQQINSIPTQNQFNTFTIITNSAPPTTPPTPADQMPPMPAGDRPADQRPSPAPAAALEVSTTKIVASTTKTAPPTPADHRPPKPASRRPPVVRGLTRAGNQEQELRAVCAEIKASTTRTTPPTPADQRPRAVSQPL